MRTGSPHGKTTEDYVPLKPRCAAIALTLTVAAMPAVAVAASDARATAKTPATVTGVQRAQRCMELKNRLVDEQAKAKGKAAKPSPTMKQDLDWYQKNCK